MLTTPDDGNGSCPKCGPPTSLSASPPPPATDGDALREALRDSMHALQALLNAVKTNPAMQGRQYIDIGIQVNNAIDKARNALASADATDGGAE